MSSRPADEARVPNFVGATGLLRIPTAYVQYDGSLSGFIAGTSHATTGGALLGIANRSELGGSVQDEGSGGTRFVGSAKLNLAPEQLVWPAVSVGVIDAFGSGRVGPSAYVVVSKDIVPYFTEAAIGTRGIAVKLHAGYGGGLYRHELFAGVEFVEANGASALGEIVAGRLSIGGRYFHQGLAITVGYIDMKTAGGSLSYSLPLR
ncbi:MAG TPA: YjbH domain-containing protein [Capsulimonadaceae bacterium]|nr:YjbH domain-containing protein [Capsulimonadaceae bacterium]